MHISNAEKCWLSFRILETKISFLKYWPPVKLIQSDIRKKFRYKKRNSINLVNVKTKNKWLTMDYTSN